MGVVNSPESKTNNIFVVTYVVNKGGECLVIRYSPNPHLRRKGIRIIVIVCYYIYLSSSAGNNQP